MGAKMLGRLIGAVIGLVGAAFAIVVFRLFEAIFTASPAALHWPVTTDTPIAREIGVGARIAWTHGSLALSGNSAVFWLEPIAQLGMLGLAIWALVALRRLLLNFAQGAFLEHRNVASLRQIGIALLGACAVSIGAALLLQPLLIGSMNLPAGLILHPSLSWNVTGAENVWLDYEVPIGTAFLGALALLFAEAIRSGIAYREDSEGVL